MIAVSDDAGAVMETFTYSPYGVAGGSSSGFPFRFTGQKLDPETGLYYYKARYYDPETGRFLQTDPIGYEDQMNLYAYVGNDPINFIDSTGLAQCDSSLEGADCETALNDTDTARGNARDAASTISGIADKIRSGDELSVDEQKVVDLVQSRFGDEFGSADNLDKVAGGLNKITDRIGERGSGAVLERGNNRGTALAYVTTTYGSRGGDNRNTIYVNDSYFGQSSVGRAQTAVHEAGHLAGFGGDLYVGRGPYSERLGPAVSANNRYRGTPKPYNLLYNADSYACSISAFQSAC